MVEITWHAPLLDSASLTNVACAGEASIVYADTMADLKSNVASLCYKMAMMRGYFSAGDGAGKLFWWNRTDTRLGDDVSIVNPDGNAGPGRWNAFIQAVNACQTPAACAASPVGLIIVNNADELRAAVVSECTEAIMLGLATAGDGFGAILRYEQASVEPDNGASAFASVFGGVWLKYL